MTRTCHCAANSAGYCWYETNNTTECERRCWYMQIHYSQTTALPWGEERRRRRRNTEPVGVCVIQTQTSNSVYTGVVHIHNRVSCGLKCLNVQRVFTEEICTNAWLHAVIANSVSAGHCLTQPGQPAKWWSFEKEVNISNIKEKEFGQKLKDSSQVSSRTWTVKMYFKTMDRLSRLSWALTSLVTLEKKTKWVTTNHLMLSQLPQLWMRWKTKCFHF